MVACYEALIRHQVLWEADTDVCWVENVYPNSWQTIKAHEPAPSAVCTYLLAEELLWGWESTCCRDKASTLISSRPLQHDSNCSDFSSMKTHLYHLFIILLIYQNMSNTSHCIWSHPRNWTSECNQAWNESICTESLHKYHHRDEEASSPNSYSLNEVKITTFSIHKHADLYTG